MIEIIVAVWSISFALSLAITAANFYVVNRQLRSTKLRRMNANLNSLGLYWSNTVGDFQKLEPGAIEDDAFKTRRGSLLLGLLGLASLPGLALLSIVVLSLRFLARSRKERAVFRSELANEDGLSAERARLVIQQVALIQ